ncbi:hypothetical protein SAMN05444851_1247 [Aliiroseovarius sediminilitoris]|uniref:Uncharacterized protein n=1 Tax=Aliiroseovarius sediminilitoris TaxID=1173584 RepID=A0A1I0P051_9RHOB|nr:hypothetical protein SAMN05444851_1247 [Aliiroseovarius sediminilitoris]
MFFVEMATALTGLSMLCLDAAVAARFAVIRRACEVNRYSDPTVCGKNRSMDLCSRMSAVAKYGSVL